eukprot:425528-Alexandrium_andersonii.AAC.1
MRHRALGAKERLGRRGGGGAELAGTADSTSLPTARRPAQVRRLWERAVDGMGIAGAKPRAA